MFSCVLVPRNKKWFESKIETIKEFFGQLLKKKELLDMNIENQEKRKKKKSENPPVVIKIDTSSIHKPCFSGDEITNS